ncbi:MAG TPA: propanediol utilization protein, partial [Candidatus Avacidaminococcus intestinavium]|nr:propanediol utilization protein [Candidatus Avacidaminococcus intestinavium]
KKNIRQIGQFAAEEQVYMITNKGELPVRVIGPLRDETQIEISITEARILGLEVSLRISGNTDSTPGCLLVGPKGKIVLKKGVIVAARHIHLCPATAEQYRLQNGDVVDVKTVGERAITFHNVAVRTGEKHVDEFHVDTDEANACGLVTGIMVEIFK